MTGAQTLAAFRRALIPAVAAGLVVMAMVVGVLLSKPPSYMARISLQATPNKADSAFTNDFAGVVAMTMQALPELAVSDGTLKAVRDKVPGAPDAATLRGAITVELVPGSGVARVAVVTGNQSTTLAVLTVVLDQITKADLLAPVASFRPIGSGNASAQLVEGDPNLAVGLGLVAALVVALLTVALVQTISPRLLTAGDVERVVDDVWHGGRDAPPVVDLKRASSGLNLLAAHLLSQNPRATEVTVVPTGPPWRGDLARQLRNALRTLRVAREVGLEGATASAPTGQTTQTAMNGLGATNVLPGGNGNGAGGVGAGGNGAGGNGAGGVGIGGGGGAGGVSSGGAAGSGTEPVASRSVVHTAEMPLIPEPARGRGLFTGPMAAGTGSAAAQAAAAAAGNGTHLVVTVRLGRTTPVALTTALIALRTHGTGVAGVAVS